MALKKEKKKAGKKSGKSSQKAALTEGEKLNVQQDTSGKKGDKSKDDLDIAISEPSSSTCNGEESASGESTVSQSKDATSLTVTKTSSSSNSKLERRASLRRKFGALIRGGAELPAAINRTLQPIKRSLSFSKDLNRVQEASKPYRATSVQWYNSLGSLAEDESADDPNVRTDRKNVFKDVFVEFPARSQVTRTRSLIEKNFVASPRRRVSAFSSQTAPYGRYSDHYDSTIDLSNPPCEASSLPALTRTAIDEDYDEYELHGGEEQQVRNRWGNLRSSARNLSFLHLGHFDAKQHSCPPLGMHTTDVYSIRSDSTSNAYRIHR